MKLSPPPNYELNPQISKAIYEERKEIAIVAMQGYVANPHSWREYGPVDIARLSVQTADALIAELNKPKEGKP